MQNPRFFLGQKTLGLSFKDFVCKHVNKEDNELGRTLVGFAFHHLDRTWLEELPNCFTSLDNVVSEVNQEGLAIGNPI